MHMSSKPYEDSQHQTEVVMSNVCKSTTIIDHEIHKKLSKSLLLFLVMVSSITNILFLVIPLFSMQVFDRVLSSESKETLIMLSVIAIFLLSIQSLLDWTRTQIALRYSYKIEQQTTNLAFSSSVSHSLRTNSATMQPLSDLARLKTTLSSPGIFALFDAPFTPVFLFVMYLMHPMLGHFALIGALLLGFISVMSMYVTKKLKANVSQGTGSLSTLTSDWLQNSDAIHALGMQENLLRKWKKESINPTVDKAKSDTTNRTITAIAKYVRMLLQIGILCTSVVLVLGNEVGAGVLIAASMLMSRVLSPLEQAIHNWQNWSEGWKAHKRLLNLAPEATSTLVELPKLEGEIKFENVTLKYSGSKEPAFRKLNFTVPAGHSMCIVGDSGSGKSLLAKAILGIVEPIKGDIRIDGATLNQRHQSTTGKQIGYVAQHNELLSGTIGQNICRFDENAEAKDIVEAAKLAGVHQMILSLPNGYQTVVGSLGQHLSGGQQQRIALARALYTKPTLLVLDEPGSNLDFSGQTSLTEFVAHANKKHITVILISHQVSLLQHTSLCMQIHDGQIKRFGKTHEVLNLPQSKPSLVESA